jgi:hypothetical protein
MTQQEPLAAKVHPFPHPPPPQPAHVIGSRTSSCVFIPLAFSAGRRFFVTVLGMSLVQLVDSTDPLSWQALQEIYLPPGSYPHAATAARWVGGQGLGLLLRTSTRWGGGQGARSAAAAQI